ncbi:MAG: glycosyltransferase family 9 protein, partial [Bacteroidota bacterium]
SRSWPAKEFGNLASYLQRRYDLNIVITGNKHERVLADEVLSFANKHRAINIAGKINLSDLVKIISESVLLISNDTGTIHLGLSVNANAVCISNGNHFGRFVPYPAEMAKKLYCVFPAEISSKMQDFFVLMEKFKNGSNLEITRVTLNNVKQTIDRIMGTLNNVTNNRKVE